MDTEPSRHLVNTELVCGILIVTAVMKEVIGGIARSPLAVAPKRPSVFGVMVVVVVAREALGRIGRSGLGLPATP